MKKQNFKELKSSNLAAEIDQTCGNFSPKSESPYENKYEHNHPVIQEQDQQKSLVDTIKYIYLLKKSEPFRNALNNLKNTTNLNINLNILIDFIELLLQYKAYSAEIAKSIHQVLELKYQKNSSLFYNQWEEIAQLINEKHINILTFLGITENFSRFHFDSSNIENYFNFIWFNLLLVHESNEIEPKPGNIYIFTQNNEWVFLYLDEAHTRQSFAINSNELPDLEPLVDRNKIIDMGFNYPIKARQIQEIIVEQKWKNIDGKFKEILNNLKASKLIIQSQYPEILSNIKYIENIFIGIDRYLELSSRIDTIINNKINQIEYVQSFNYIFYSIDEIDFTYLQKLFYVLHEEKNSNLSLLERLDLFSLLLSIKKLFNPEIYKKLINENFEVFFNFYLNIKNKAEKNFHREIELFCLFLNEIKSEEFSTIIDIYLTEREKIKKYRLARLYLPIHAYSLNKSVLSALKLVNAVKMSLLEDQKDENGLVLVREIEIIDAFCTMPALKNSELSDLRDRTLLFISASTEEDLLSLKFGIIASMTICINYCREHHQPENSWLKINFLLLWILTKSMNDIKQVFELLNNANFYLNELHRLAIGNEAIHEPQRYLDFIEKINDSIRKYPDFCASPKDIPLDAIIETQASFILDYLKFNLTKIITEKVMIFVTASLPHPNQIKTNQIYFTQNGEYLFKNPGIPLAITGKIEDKFLLEILSNTNTNGSFEFKCQDGHTRRFIEETPFLTDGVADWIAVIMQEPQMMLPIAIKLLADDDKRNLESERSIQFTIYNILSQDQKDLIQNLINSLGINSSEREVVTSKIKNVNGFITEDLKETDFPIRATIRFNQWIESTNYHLKHFNGLTIRFEDFIKILDCIAGFDDLTETITTISSEPQTHWLKFLLVKSIAARLDDQLLDELMSLDVKLLTILNNRLIQDCAEQMINAHYLSGSTLVMVEKLGCLIQLLNEVIPEEELITTLSSMSLHVWQNILSDAAFGQLFHRLMTNYANADKIQYEKCLLYCNRIRHRVADSRLFTVFFKNLAGSIKNNHIKSLQGINRLLGELYYQRLSFKAANQIVQTEDSLRNWIGKHTVPLPEIKHFSRNLEQRSIAKVMQLIRENSFEDKYSLSSDMLNKIQSHAENFKKQAEKVISNNENNIQQMINGEIIKLNNEQAYQGNPEEYVHQHISKIASLILCAWYAANNDQFPHDTQIVTFAALITSRNQGLLGQVRTGEGKTLIVGLFAAFLGLCGHAVDILSSNSDLAIEGAEKCRPFFNLLKLDCDHICHRDSQANLSAYKNPIVYGEITVFQGDLLQQEYLGVPTYGDRYAKTQNQFKEKYAIIDEVDSMSLDKAKDVLYLSHTIESLKWLDGIFLNILAAVLRVDVLDSDQIRRHVTDISQFILTKIDSGAIFAPKELAHFYKLRMPRWVESAFQSRYMNEKDHFVIDVEKTGDIHSAGHKNVIVMDKDTGLEQYATRWCEGLAQFLEFIYQRKQTAESLKAFFISNKTFFLGYDQHIYGLTGTLGSADSRNFLAEVYQVKFIDIPSAREKNFYEYPGSVVTNYSEWLELVTKKAIDIAQQRPVLIIFENIELTEQCQYELMHQGASLHEIKKYACSEDKIETGFRNQPATAHDFIIATNKGGRGTDIHVDEKTFAKGGLHVMLTYLPNNLRIEEQAFGRTSRNGAPGTGELILYSNLEDEKSSILTEDQAQIFIEKEKLKRDHLEFLRLTNLQQKNMIQVDVEQALLLKFNQFRKDFLKPFKFITVPERKINVDEKKSFEAESKDSPLLTALDKILQDRWAFWLDSKKRQIEEMNPN